MVVDGVAYATVKEAKLAQIEGLFSLAEGKPDQWSVAEIADWIISHEGSFLDVLNFNEASRPKARKSNGAVRKPRTKITAAAGDQQSLAVR